MNLVTMFLVFRSYSQRHCRITKRLRLSRGEKVSRGRNSAAGRQCIMNNAINPTRSRLGYIAHLSVATRTEHESSTADDFLNTSPSRTLLSVGRRASRRFHFQFNSPPVATSIGAFQVDFQLCLYSSPAVDLHYLFSTSVFEEIDDELSTEALLEEYHRTLTATMKQLNCKTQPPTLKELKKSMDERLVHALTSSMSILPFALTQKDEVKTIDDMVKEKDKFESPGIKSPTFQKIMLKRLKKFDEAGILD